MKEKLKEVKNIDRVKIQINEDHRYKTEKLIDEVGELLEPHKEYWLKHS